MGVENRANVVVDTMARERSPAKEYSHAKTMLAWLALFLFAETAPWSMAARADIASIRIAFFFTGLHRDYNQRTDEPEFIDYPRYARIANYIKDITVEVANGPRPKVTGTNPARSRVITPSSKSHHQIAPNKV